MATLREYYKHDFHENIRLHATWHFSTINSELKFDVIASVHLDFESNTKFLSFYIPYIPEPYNLLITLLQRLPQALKIANDVEISIPISGKSSTYSYNLKFTDRVFFYYEGEFNQVEVNKILEIATKKQLFLEFRDNTYFTLKNEKEVPLAFISHDFRDKEEIASKIALDLVKMNCPVWYDEYSLRVGDSLRETIEKGLKECRKCILILSPNFLSNEGWTKTEFNSIFTREIIEKKNLILPIWCDITKRELFDYSPILADRVGINWNKGHENVSRKLYHAITSKRK